MRATLDAAFPPRAWQLKWRERAWWLVTHGPLCRLEVNLGPLASDDRLRALATLTAWEADGRVEAWLRMHQEDPGAAVRYLLGVSEDTVAPSPGPLPPRPPAVVRLRFVASRIQDTLRIVVTRGDATVADLVLDIADTDGLNAALDAVGGSEYGRLRARVLVRDRWTCSYCGRALTPRDATLDHVVPRSRGGTDADDNVVAACERCNAEKGNLDRDEFLRRRRG